MTRRVQRNKAPWSSTARLAMTEVTIGRAGRSFAPGHGLAIGAIAATILMLPLQAPVGPANTSPIDVLFAVAIGATLYWAGTNRIVLRTPYVFPVGATVVIGTAAALAGQFPLLELQAVVQDLFLFAWGAAFANVARTPGTLARVGRLWAGSAVVWSGFLLVAVV